MTTKRKMARDMVKAIKPLLSSEPIVDAKIEMPVNDISVLTVKFIVTPKLLEALAKDEKDV
jgi:hypothetical protein